MASGSVPSFVLDALGREVIVGDVIAYGSLLGRSAALKFGRIEAFTRNERGEVRIRVRGGRRVEGWDIDPATGYRTVRAGLRWQFARAGSLDADLRRFVRLSPEQAAWIPNPPEEAS